MSNVRFATTRALFDTFPTTITKLAIAPTDEPPLIFLRTLMAKEKLEEAVTFCAYLLPRREAVWWACECVRALLLNITGDRAAGLLAAEAWVEEPDEGRRQVALEVGTKGNCNDALSWVALAAGWAGGFLVSNPHRRIPMPQYMTARAARTAILISALQVSRHQRPDRLESCVVEGKRLAGNGP
jgi:hypothetical protein